MYVFLSVLFVMVCVYVCVCVCVCVSLCLTLWLAVQTQGADVHAMAGLLKMWLRELSEPLIPYDL